MKKEALQLKTKYFSFWKLNLIYFLLFSGFPLDHQSCKFLVSLHFLYINHSLWLPIGGKLYQRQPPDQLQRQVGAQRGQSARPTVHPQVCHPQRQQHDHLLGQQNLQPDWLPGPKQLWFMIPTLCR